MDPKTTDPWGGDEFDPDTVLASIAKLGTTNRTKLIRFYFPGIKYEVQFSHRIQTITLIPTETVDIFFDIVSTLG